MKRPIPLLASHTEWRRSRDPPLTRVTGRFGEPPSTSLVAAPVGLTKPDVTELDDMSGLPALLGNTQGSRAGAV
jgi:hypothetical protein